MSWETEENWKSKNQRNIKMANKLEMHNKEFLEMKI